MEAWWRGTHIFVRMRILDSGPLPCARISACIIYTQTTKYVISVHATSACVIIFIRMHAYNIKKFCWKNIFYSHIINFIIFFFYFFEIIVWLVFLLSWAYMHKVVCFLQSKRAIEINKNLCDFSEQSSDGRKPIDRRYSIIISTGNATSNEWFSKYKYKSSLFSMGTNNSWTTT